MRSRLVIVATAVAFALLLGGCGVALPDVKGMTADQATRELEAAGFTIGGIRYDPEATGAAGAVVGQAPGGGERAKQGAPVSLVIAGKPPVDVPGLTGLGASEASAALAALELLGITNESYSPTVPAGTVVEQSPTSGTVVPSGSAVHLVLSRGPAPRKVPYVVGMAQGDAEATLKTAGFKYQVRSSHSTKTKGNVLSQSPSGKSMPLGSTIQLTVSLGPKPKPKPAPESPEGEFAGRFDVYEVVFGVGRTGRAFVYVDGRRILADCPYMDLTEGDSVRVQRRADGSWVIIGR